LDSTGRDAAEGPQTGHGAGVALWAAATCVSAAAFAAIVIPLAGGDVSTVVAVVAVLVPLLAAFVLASVALFRLRTESDRIAAEAERARRLADQDALTGVGNYRTFWRSLRGECARAERHGGAFTLALIDLDDFKRVNDEHGHRAGDDVLRAVAGALRGAIRAEDALCRQGGDEFAVVAVAAGVPEASLLAARLAAAVAAVELGRELGWPPQASVGTATYGRAGSTPDEIMEAADAALRAVKSARPSGADRALKPRALRPSRLTRRARSG
jgi:diguanylate cyclase (GGDEF)-like protein